MTLRNAFRLALIAAALLGLAASLYHADRARRDHHQQRARRAADAQSRWAAILDREAAEIRELRGQAVEPVDDYFNQQALPGITALLGDFSGPVDSASFLWRELADKIKIRDDDQRVKTKIQSSLATHLGFPRKLQAAIDDSVLRYRAILQQRDSALRDQAYAELQGAGIPITPGELQHLLAGARAAAERAAVGRLAEQSLVDFANAMAGKEVALIAVQTLILERVALAIGRRLGILSLGAAAASASSAGGPPGWALAAGEIIAALGADLLAGWWLESRAQSQMTAQLREVQKEIGAQLGLYMAEYESNLRVQRLALMDRKLKE